MVEKKDRPVSSLTMSVTSIDTGYQGDAECDVQSATTSAINTPVDEQKMGICEEKEIHVGLLGSDPCVLRHPRTDVGSDSDFCSDMGTSWTESEMECDEKIKGRSARVIDGTLYYNNDGSEEKTIRVEDGHLGSELILPKQVSEDVTGQKVIELKDSDSSTTLEDSQSQNFVEGIETVVRPNVLRVESKTVPNDSKEMKTDSSDTSGVVSEIRHSGLDCTKEDSTESKSRTPKSPLTPMADKSVDKTNNKNKKVHRKWKADAESTAKRYKSPKKNVMSKIKAMIEATTCTNNGNSNEDGNEENVTNEQTVPKKIVRTPKKSRWEAVMSKIAAGKAEEKAKGKTKREVRSRVDTNLATASNKDSPREKENRNSEVVRSSIGAARLLKRDSTFSSEQASISEGDPVLDHSNRSSRSDLSGSRANTAKTKVHQVSAGTAASFSSAARSDSPKPDRPLSPSQLSDISTMSAASHLSSFSQASSLRTLQKSSTSLSSLNTSRLRKDPSSQSSVSSDLLRNNRKNAAASNKVAPINLSPGSGAKKAQPTSLPNGNLRSAASKAVTGRDSKPAVVRQQPRSLNVKPPLPQQRANAPKTAATNQVQLTKEQNRVRSLKSSPGIKSGNQQTNLLNSTKVSSKVDTEKELIRVEKLCESHAKEISRLQTLLAHRTMGMEALSVVVKYMADDLDALSHPIMVKELASLRSMLDVCKNNLDQTIQEKESLQTKTAGLIVSHHSELTKLKQDHADEIVAIKETLSLNHESDLKKLTDEFAEKERILQSSYETKLEDLKLQHDESDKSTKEKNESEIERLRLQFEADFKKAETEYDEKVATLTKDYTAVQNSLQEQLQTLNSQCSNLQRQKRDFEEVILKDSDLKFQVAAGKIADLEKEVDSLKTVLELRNNEIHELRAASNKVKKLEDDLHFSDERVKFLTTKMEDLRAQVDRKNTAERQLSNQNKLLKEWYDKETNVNKRLSMENEQLQWKLHQSMEGSSLAALWGNSPITNLDYTSNSPNTESPVNSSPVLAGASDGDSLDYNHYMCKRGLASSKSSKSRAISSAREVRTPRHRRQRFSISEEDSVSNEMDLSPGTRYRRAQSLSWTVGVKPNDDPASPLSGYEEVPCNRNLAADFLLPNGNGETDLDEIVENESMEISEANRKEEQIADKVVQSSSDVNVACNAVESCEKISESDLKAADSPSSSDKQLEISVVKKSPLERRKSSTPDARVPSLITVQYLDEQNPRPHSSASLRTRRERGGSLGNLKSQDNSIVGSPRSKSSPKKLSPKREKVNNQVDGSPAEQLKESKTEAIPAAVNINDVMNSSLDTIEIDYAMRCSTHSSETCGDEPSSNAKESDVMYSSSDFEDPTPVDPEEIHSSADQQQRDGEEDEEVECDGLSVPLLEDKPPGSSCGSSPPPDLLQMSESSRSEDSSARASPAYRARPGDESLSQSASCNYAMSPRTSAGESMVVVDVSGAASVQRRDHASEATALLMRRTFPELYLQENTGNGCCGNSDGKDDDGENGLSYISKPDTPESSSLAVAPTDSTNIDLSWSEEEDDDIPSESEV